MVSKEVNDFLTKVDVSAEDPSFYEKVFAVAYKLRKKEFEARPDPVKKIIMEEYGEFSRRIDRAEIQDSSAVRNVLRSRALANLLINDKGEFDKALLDKMIPILKDHLYSFGPNRQFDGPRQEHILKALELLQKDGILLRKLRLVSKPFNHQYAEEIIRETLELPHDAHITDVQARRAVLSALLCFLRQNVGSCFATAPAIIVHEEQPSLFLDDILEILSTGQLKRTFGGKVYAVPMSRSWGAGDLKRIMAIPKEAGEGKSDLWLSPGLIYAFEACGLIEKSIPLKEKMEACRSLVTNLFAKTKCDEPYYFLSPEDLIEKVILNHYGLTEENIKEYENRPIGLIQGGFLMQVSHSEGEKNRKITQYLQAIKLAKDAFKALADNALLKVWEFTLASFAETKAQFSRWNLFASLGMGPNEKGGIGEKIFAILQQKLDESNRKMDKYNEEYEQIYNQVKTLEMRVNSPSSETDAKWLRAEYQAHVNEMRTFEEMRNRVHYKSQRFANFFNVLQEIYYLIFPRFFQEVYDADMHDIKGGPYDDSPAGFRLLYKHGRSNTAQWTLIYNQHDFIDALSNFFIASEREIRSLQELTGLEDDFSEIVTAIVTHVRTEEFLESALHRMAAAHQSRIPKNPLQHLDLVEKKPWVYTSGGAMNTLVSCYFGREENPTESDRWVENPAELLVWLVDNVKQMPDSVLDELEKNREKGFLIHSPTHAFIFRPGLFPFSELWKSKKYTYIDIRDRYIDPMKYFVQRLWLDQEAMQYFVQHFAQKIPEEARTLFLDKLCNLSGYVSSVEFRETILDKMQSTPGLRYGRGTILEPDTIDGELYSLLPLFPVYQLKEKIQKIYDKINLIPKKVRTEALSAFDALTGSYGGIQLINAQQLQDISKALLCIANRSTTCSYDIHFLVSRAAQELEYAMSTPIIFADTNWVRDLFAFVVNPGTGELELWRTDYTGRTGQPMSIWVQWLNGTRRDIKWGLYYRAHEYVAIQKGVA